MSIHSKSRIFLAAEIAFILIISAVILLPINPINMRFAGRDSGVFLYTGWRILNGEIPYRDVWDHKTPGIFYLDALGLAVSGGSRWGVWFVELVFLFAAAYVGYLLLKKLFGIYPAIVSTFLWLYTFLIVLAGGNLTQEYTLPFQFAVLWLFSQWDETKPDITRAYLLGLIGGAAFVIRQNAIGVVLSVAAYLFVEGVISKRYRRLSVELLYLVLGSVTIPLMVAIYFISKGALADLWSAAFVFNFYDSTGGDWGDRLIALKYIIGLPVKGWLSYTAFAGWGFSVAWLMWNVRKTQSRLSKFMWMAALTFLVEVAFVGITGRPRIPYYMTLLPIFAVFSGFLFRFIFSFIEKTIAFRYTSLALAIAILTVFVGSNFRNYLLMMTPNEPSTAQVKETVDYILANTSSGDYVAVWGAESYLNFHTQRRSPSRFVYQIPLFFVDYAGEKMLVEFLSAVVEKRPKLVVATIRDGRIVSGFGANQSERAEVIGDLIRKMYTEVRRVDNWVIYRYNGFCKTNVCEVIK
jgi:4-amino-4-deoxy-L-arabinose transferase-like glycosyltransferase